VHLKKGQIPFQINIQPLFVNLTTSHVIVASKDGFYVWHFRTAQSWTHLRLDSSRNSKTPSSNQPESGAQTQTRPERLYHVDDAPAGGVHSAHLRGSANSDKSSEITPTTDPICCMTSSDKILIIARESGMIQRYAMPNVALTNRYQINTKPHKLALNCNST
jgi:WD repeat-containing protein 35